MPRATVPRIAAAGVVLLAAWLVAYAVWIAVAGRPAPLFDAPVAIGVGALASILLLVRAAVGDGERRAWLLLGAGFALWSAGDATELLLPPADAVAPGFGDIAYLLSFAAIAAGLLALLGPRRGPLPVTLGLDALTAGLAVAALAAWLVVAPVFATFGASMPLGTRALHIALPLGSGVLLVLAVWGLAAVRWRPDRTWSLVAAGVAALWVAEAGFAVTAADGTWSPTTPTNHGWTASVLLAAAGAWFGRPAAQARRLRAPDSDARDVALPLVFAVGAVALLVADRWVDVPVAAIGLAAAALLTSLVRLVVTSHQHAVLLRASRHEALTDPLTGLGNRRRLDRDLHAALGADAPTAVVLFDLDGFKAFNDRAGHLAGDALLVAIGGELAADVGIERAFRLGGDELCALVEVDEVQAVVDVVRRAAAFAGIGCSAGSAVLGAEAVTTDAALRLADQRLYADKADRRTALTRAAA